MKRWLGAHAELAVKGLLIASTLALYLRVARFDFVFWDDTSYVVENEHVLEGLTATSVKGAFEEAFASNWQPVTLLSHIWDVQFNKLCPGYHHLTSVLLHLLNALLLFTILKGMTGRTWPSAFVAAVFALHPLHVESVAWVSGRKDVLSTLLGLLSIWAYAAYGTGGKHSQYLLSLLFLILGLLSKPMLVTWPIVFLLLDYWPLRRFRIGGTETGTPSDLVAIGPNDSVPVRTSPLGRLILEKVPFLVVAGFFCVVTFLVESPSMDRVGMVPISGRVVNAFYAYMWYIDKTVCPTGLCCLYMHPSLPGGSPLTFWQVGGAVALLLLVSLVVIWKRDHRYLAVGWLWYLVTLVPVIGLVRVGSQGMADRYMYVPLIGLLIMMSWSIDGFLPRVMSRRPWTRTIAAGAGIAYLTALCVCSSMQLNSWRDSRSLYERALAINPNNPQMLANMSFLYLLDQNLSKAVEYAEKTLRLAPEHTVAMANMGAYYLGVGDLENCERCCLRVLKQDDVPPSVYYNIGMVRLVRGQYDEALESFRKGLAAKPNWLWAQERLAWVLAVRPHPRPSDREEALRLALHVAHKCGCAGCLDTLAAAQAAAGQFDVAVQTAEKALTVAQAQPTVDEEMKQAMKERLGLYQQGQAFTKHEGQDGRRAKERYVSKVSSPQG